TKPALALPTIADILSAAVDAIGPSGWISASDDNLGPELDLIADMKSEISAALAGVEEATYLKGVLREYIWFADSVAHRGRGDKKSSSSSSVAVRDDDAAAPLVRHEKLNGADLMVYGPPDRDGFDGDAGGKMLPLSLKAPTADVSRTKVNKSTGEVLSRSSREIGHLRRKQAGEYSFERLFV
ncbi:hypothetical protein PHISP_05123, partial [Aspergillus sp. HF37]